MKKLLFIMIAIGGYAHFGGKLTFGDDHTRAPGASLPNLAFIKEVPFLKDSPIVGMVLTALGQNTPAAQPAQYQYAAPGMAAPTPGRLSFDPHPAPPPLPRVTNLNGTVALQPAGVPTAPVNPARTGPEAYTEQLTAVAKALK